MGGGFRATPTGGGFDVSSNTGSGGVGSFVQFHFAYAKHKQTWLLKDVESGNYDVDDEHSTRTGGMNLTFDELDGSGFGVHWACVG